MPLVKVIKYLQIQKSLCRPFLLRRQWATKPQFSAEIIPKRVRSDKLASCKAQSTEKCQMKLRVAGSNTPLSRHDPGGLWSQNLIPLGKAKVSNVRGMPGGMLKLRLDRYITILYHAINAIYIILSINFYNKMCINLNSWYSIGKCMWNKLF